MRRFALALALLPSTFASVAHAVPGPDSVAVLANASVPGSVALAMQYAAFRDVPAAQVCALAMPTTDTITQSEYETQILAPLRACLGPDVEARIEAVAVMRGVPLRVTMPVDGHAVSITAALMAWRSTNADGTPLLGTPPGTIVDCGSPCYGARVSSPYTSQPFRAGFTADLQGIHHVPVLATMLHGRSDDDAARLIESARAAEAAGDVPGEILLMQGADPARGVLDPSYPGVVSQLVRRGLTASVVPFDADLTGHPLAGFVTGAAGLGMTIEGNTYAPGALVDNLTSFGAVPQNFAPSGESQVSIARWVALGVGGAHGTVDEPLNNVFPARHFLVDYADGATLAEAYLGAMPFTYWLNLVLGDPMLAPYAQRPVVTIEGVAEGASLASSPMLHVTATAPAGRSIAHLVLIVNGEEVASADAATLDHCLAIAPGTGTQILAVAETAPAAVTDHAHWPAKGWRSLHVDASATDATCEATSPDAGPRDGAIGDGSAADAASGVGPSASCSCGVAGARSDAGAPTVLMLLAIAWLVRRRTALRES